MSTAEEGEPPSPGGTDGGAAVDETEPRGEEEKLETGGLLAEWAAALDPTVFELPVLNPHARDTAGTSFAQRVQANHVPSTGFASLCATSLFSQLPLEQKLSLVSRVAAESPRSPLAKAMGVRFQPVFSAFSPVFLASFVEPESPRCLLIDLLLTACCVARPWSPSPPRTPLATGSSSWTPAIALAPAESKLSSRWRSLSSPRKFTSNLPLLVIGFEQIACARHCSGSMDKDRPHPNAPGGKPACFSGSPLNKFFLQMGQWTDDCSMGLTIADSLIVKRAYDGSDIRMRFWNWWNCGYCNAFRKDTVS